MNFTAPIVSESISPMVPMIFFGAIGLGLLAVVVVVGARRGQGDDKPRSVGRTFGLAVGWVATVAGALLIVMLATTRGGAPRFMYIAAALPLLAGVRILQVCRRSRSEG